jgi:5'-nucleotidase
VTDSFLAFAVTKDPDTTALEPGAISISPLSVDGSARPGQGWLESRLRRP